VDDIKQATPCTLLYVKGRTLSTIEIVDAIVMPGHIIHGWPIPSECAVVEVTTIREGHVFKDLDYQKGEEGLRSGKMLTGISSYDP
jgi:hypothetical protein